MYIYSTLSSAVVYRTTHGDVKINGGANIPDKHLYTPYGVVTKVTDDQYEGLKAHYLFQMHESNGFVTADSAKEDADEVASNMTGRDDSAPDTEASLLASDDTIEKIKDGVVTRKGK